MVGCPPAEAKTMSGQEETRVSISHWARRLSQIGDRSPRVLEIEAVDRIGPRGLYKEGYRGLKDRPGESFQASRTTGALPSRQPG